MNHVTLSGRLARDPEMRYSQGENPIAIARYTIAVNRPVRNGEEQKADFINCIAFGKRAEFAEKFMKKGSRYMISGRLQTGSYENKDGQTVYYTEVLVEEQEFADSSSGNANGGQQNGSNNRSGKGNSQGKAQTPKNNASSSGDGFMNIPDGLDEELPFN